MKSRVSKALYYAVAMGAILLLLVSGCGLLQSTATLQLSVTASPVEGPVPLSVQFTAVATPGKNVRYSWEFDGDGHTDAQGATTQAVFKRVGQYQVVVRALDESGRAGQAELMINAQPPPQPLISLGGAVDPSDVWLQPFQTGSTQLTVEGANQGVSEVQSGSISFDPGVVQILAIRPLAPFQLSGVSINNSTGQASFTAQSGLGAASGESIGIARILLRGGGRTTTSQLRLTVGALLDGGGGRIGFFRVLDGRVQVAP